MPIAVPSMVVAADMPTHSPSGQAVENHVQVDRHERPSVHGKFPADAVGRVDHGDEPAEAGEGLPGDDAGSGSGSRRWRARGDRSDPP